MVCVTLLKLLRLEDFIFGLAKISEAIGIFTD
jgi:hypothetical protein